MMPFLMRCLFLLLLVPGFLLAQQDTSLRVLTFEDYSRLVYAWHPVARLSETLPEAAKGELRMARGAFDPVLKQDWDRKELDDKEYWNTWKSGLNVPVWYGFDLKLNYENNRGEKLDNALFTPENGLTYAGISVPLGQGLLIDQRRASLRQAQLGVRIAAAERVKLINKLLLQAAKDYFDWAFTFNRLRLHRQSLQLAEIRFQAVRERVLFGDLPALDSLEAYIEVQNRQNILTQSEMEYNNARLIASNHLWSEQQAPLEIDANVLPQIAAAELQQPPAGVLDSLLVQAQSLHPEIEKFAAKLEQLDVEKRWAAEKLRPKLQVDYNFLRSGSRPWSTETQNFSLDNNYKMGVQFSVPLLLRQERGKLSLTKLKIRQTDWERQQTAREISNAIRTTYNEMLAIRTQVSLQEEQVLNAARMLEGEQFRFSNGEGSVFLMNQRENSMIGAQIKLEELKAKFGKSKALFYWSAGALQTQFAE